MPSVLAATSESLQHLISKGGWELEQDNANKKDLEKHVIDEQKRNLELEKKLAATEGILSSTEKKNEALTSQLNEMHEIMAVQRAEIAQMKLLSLLLVS